MFRLEIIMNTAEPENIKTEYKMNTQSDCNFVHITSIGLDAKKIYITI